MAIATRVNNQHLMYRKDILADLGIDVPKPYDEVLAAAEKIKAAGVVDYPLGGTFKSGWNVAEEFVNMYLGFKGDFIDDAYMPTINNETGVAALETMKALAAYVDPEYLISDSTYVQQQFQQGKIAMANLCATRAAAMDDDAESQVVGKVGMAGASVPVDGGIPASSNWWGGWAIAKNISDEAAEAAFKIAMEGTDTEMVQANNDMAVCLVDGYVPGDAAQGVVETMEGGAVFYPASQAMGIMHSELGNGIPAFLKGEKTAEEALADIEAAYLVSAKKKGLVN